MCGLRRPWVPTSLDAGSGGTREADEGAKAGNGPGCLGVGGGEDKAGWAPFPWLCKCALQSQSHRGGNGPHGDGWEECTWWVSPTDGETEAQRSDVNFRGPTAMLLLSPWPRLFLLSQEKDKVSSYLPFTWLEFFMLITEKIHIIEK